LAVIADSSSKLLSLGIGQFMIDDAEYAVEVLRKSLPTLRSVIPDPDIKPGVYGPLLMTRDEARIWHDVARTIGGIGTSTP
jgi:hypothetical protein